MQLDQTQLRMLTEFDHVARVPGHGGIGRGAHKHQLHRRLDFLIGHHAQHHAVGRASGIDARKSLARVATRYRRL
jgi:hypothetical protein